MDASEEPKLSSVEILENIKLVINEYKQWKAKKTYFGFNELEFKKAMFEKYTSFAESSPILFSKATKGDFEKPAELDRLKYLMSMANKVNSSNNYNAVSKEVNHKFSTDFGVYDLVNKLEKERLEKENSSITSTSGEVD